MSPMHDELPDTAFCLNCGYSLRQLPKPICPECGRPFDPANARTYRDAAKSDIFRRFAWPPRRWHRYAVVISTLVVLLLASTPDCQGLIGILCGYAAIVLLMVIVADYLLRLAVAGSGLYRSGYGREPPLAGSRRRHWLVTPLCVALVALTWWYPWSLRLRFRLSEPAFARVVQSGASANQPQMIGLYRVDRVVRYSDGSVFLVTGDWGFVKCGFLYVPPGQLIQDDELSTTYRLTESWHTRNLFWR